MWDEDTDQTLQWEFYAIQHKTNSIQELAVLLENSATHSHAVQLIKTINDLCFHELGPKLFLNNPNICHEAVTGEGIYSFRKGNIRLYWFYGHERRIVICPMVSVKKTQKTPKEIVKKLKDFKTSYFEASKKQSILYKK
mgnify:CR=1 FL=1